MPLPQGRGSCSVAGCDRDIFTNRGWCGMHYQRWLRHGDAAWEPPTKATEICSVAGCDEPARAKGLCLADYQRDRYRRRRQKAGFPEPAPLERECDLCGAQYRRTSRGYRYCSTACSRAARALYHLLRDYGLTREAYYELLERQGYVCAICGGEDEVKGVLSVDHCHATGRVRGLLCHTCNVGLGHFKDDPELIARAGAYLALTPLGSPQA